MGIQASVLKATVQLNDNNAGVYGSAVRTGTIHVGQPVRLVPEGREPSDG